MKFESCMTCSEVHDGAAVQSRQPRGATSQGRKRIAYIEYFVKYERNWSMPSYKVGLLDLLISELLHCIASPKHQRHDCAEVKQNR